VSSLVVAVAQYALFLVAAGAVLVWLRCSRPDKVSLAVQAVVTLIAVAVLVRVAGLVHTDPRPFVVDPSVKPLFAHPADNGFPSDHTALAAGVAFLIVLYRRWVGIALVAVSVAIGVCRVAAHVHHTQDIVGGLLIGLLAALCGLLAWRALEAVRDRRRARITTPPITRRVERSS
jgi:membrane-associated phospholipid phosphatase